MGLRASFVDLLVSILIFVIATHISPTYSSETSCSPKYVTYTAAVLEYEPYSRYSDDSNPTGNEVLHQNAVAFRDYAEKAKQQGADIFIAPEYGLQSLFLDIFDTEKMIKYSQYVPHPADKVNPFEFHQENPENEQTMALSLLSEAAANNEIYMVINLLEVLPCSEETVGNSPYGLQPLDNCPPSGYVFYNTQVVFDRSGVVIARYRKQQLFQEEYDMPGPRDDDSAVFVTDFDVAFSLQICFDAIYEHPGPYNVRRYGIKDIAMSTAWLDAAPYLLAFQAHNGFAQGLGVNLLVSGYHLPEWGLLGSGMYKWFKEREPKYVFNKDSGDVLLVGKVSTLAKSFLASSSHRKEWEEYHAKEAEPKNVEEEKKILVGLKWNDRFDKQPQVGVFPPVEKTESGSRGHLIREGYLVHAAVLPLQETKDGEQKTVNTCYQGFCCEIKYSHTGTNVYKLLVDSIGFMAGRHKVASYLCSVVMCPLENSTQCAFPAGGFPKLDEFGPFTLTANFDGPTTLVYPGAVSGDFKLLQNKGVRFEHDEETNTYALRSDVAVDNVLALSLYKRNYALDTEKWPLGVDSAPVII